jgi:hypothetical protein
MWDRIACSRPLICTGARPNLATCRTHRGSWQRRFDSCKAARAPCSSVGSEGRGGRRGTPTMALHILIWWCIRLWSAMVGVPHRPLLPSLPTSRACRPRWSALFCQTVLGLAIGQWILCEKTLDANLMWKDSQCKTNLVVKFTTRLYEYC